MGVQPRLSLGSVFLVIRVPSVASMLETSTLGAHPHPLRIATQPPSQPPPPPPAPTPLPSTMACYMPASSSTFVAVLLQKPPPPLLEPTAPHAAPKSADCPLAAVAHAQELLPSPTLVDTVVVNGRIRGWLRCVGG